MAKNILVVGGKGNMGSRYCSILRHLKHNPSVCDVGHIPIIQDDSLDGIIIATPTNTHYDMIKHYHKEYPKAPILCEKPISKDINEVKLLCEIDDLNLTMVNQYRDLLRMSPLQLDNNDTKYDFYNSGKDGKYWDCINIIGLSESDNITIRNEGALWDCVIDGRVLSFGFLYESYIAMIRRWLSENYNPRERSYIIYSHKKVIDYIRDKND